ncbi:GGDEF domain-containing protein [Chitinivorax sp. PXF-14]|uniref:GGDEF domain-containing protein n=1 Tax=Chitinivorax sp. PXF-14 TaxID=3230488 RepID=UPI003465FA56
MEKSVNPSLVARETLKLMAQRKVMPDPENYRRIYNEIAGIEAADDSALVSALMQPLREGAGSSPVRQRALRELEQAVQDKRWTDFFSLYEDELLHSIASGHFARPWAELIRDLIREWDLHRPGFSSSKKKEALERVLTNFGADLSSLNEKLTGMLKGWAEGGTPSAGVEVLEADGETGVLNAAAPASPAASGATAPGGPVVAPAGTNFGTWVELLGLILDIGVVARLGGLPHLQEEAAALKVAVANVRDEGGLLHFAAKLRKFCTRLELQNDTEERLLGGLLRLLELLVENIAELVIDDKWLEGQLVVVRDLIVKPLSVGRIYDAEASFKEVIVRQSVLKQGLNEAKATFKNMIATFIDRLGAMSSTTGNYHDKVTTYAERIKQTDDMVQLNRLLSELMNDTRSMQVDMLRSRDDMLEARRQADEAERRIDALENELKTISEKVREDHLTGALNRRGLEESFRAELSRSEREDMPLSVAILDIDNFKQLNDRLGHMAGDSALVHLVKVVKDTLRPTDVVARYGGEEFVVLLANTPLEEGVNVMARLQRELTKQFFLYNNERLLITFSAGVATYRAGEEQESVIGRADEAMYVAKKTGKNKVVAAG